MIVRLLENDVLMYQYPSGAAAPIMRLPMGLVFDIPHTIEGKSGTWAEVCLPDKQRGFIHSNIKVYIYPIMRLNDPATPFFAQPGSPNPIDTLQQRSVVTVLVLPTSDMPFYHILDSAGRTGFIPGSAKAKRWNPGIPMVQYASRPTALLTTALGLLMAIGGIALAAFTFSPEHQSSFRLPWVGLFAAGLFLFARGLNQFKSGSAPPGQ